MTLDCPSDCVYLQQAREHEKPRSIEELDQTALFPKVEIGDQFLYEQEHLILGLSYALAKSARIDHGVRDVDLIAASQRWPATTRLWQVPGCITRRRSQI